VCVDGHGNEVWRAQKDEHFRRAEERGEGWIRYRLGFGGEDWVGGGECFFLVFGSSWWGCFWSTKGKILLPLELFEFFVAAQCAQRKSLYA
jgi:hypothetical protein